VAIAQYLLDRGAPLDHADKSGKTALDLATLNGNPALVQVSEQRVFCCCFFFFFFFLFFFSVSRNVVEKR